MEDPLREHLHAQRMLALYRSGRQAEALEAYRDARSALVEQIGVEPGAELRSCRTRSSPRTPRSTSPRPRRVAARAPSRAAAAQLGWSPPPWSSSASRRSAMIRVLEPDSLAGSTRTQSG